MSNFLKTIIKNSGNEYAGIASEGIEGSDVTGFYVRTEHYKLYYDNDAKFLKLETIITNPFPNISSHTEGGSVRKNGNGT